MFSVMTNAHRSTRRFFTVTSLDGPLVSVLAVTPWHATVVAEELTGIESEELDAEANLRAYIRTQKSSM